MKTGTLTITFLHYWHCGTGQGGAGDLDLVPETEESGLPIVKGKTLKGRLKQTGRELGFSHTRLENLFGQENGRYGKEAVILELTNAKMVDEFSRVCRDTFVATRHPAPEVAALFEDIASTATENGVAKARSLRRFRYAVPVVVKASWTLHQDALLDDLTACAVNLDAIGHGKRDGYGWCKVEFAVDGAAPNSEAAPGSSASGTEEVSDFDLDLELLDDVVFSATSATEGGHRTLDHAPGSALLGAAAKTLFAPPGGLGEHDGALALARGDISFGNAYVVTSDGRPTLPIPFSWHEAKNDESGTVHNFAIVDWDKSPIATKQPVQLRDGYVHFDRNGKAEKPGITRRQSLRTAITDLLEQYEVAATGKLFGFEALASGTKLRSRIEVRGEQIEKLREIIRNAFGGDEKIIRLGRSKSTEYGRARCTLSEAGPERNGATANGIVRFLAASDLALLDAKGQPTLRPTPKHFGLPAEWKLLESKCYLRTRRFSLWNAKRGGPDLERQVISKGSVIVFEGSGSVTPHPRVGIGQGEGLGRVLIEPPLLLAEQVQLPKPDVALSAQSDSESQPVFGDDKFSACITERYARKNFDVVLRKIAARWVQEWSALKIPVSASQWGELGRQLRGTAKVENLLTRLGTMENPDKNTFFGNQSRARQWKGDPGKPDLAAVVIAGLGEKGESDELKLAAFEHATAAMAAQQRQASEEPVMSTYQRLKQSFTIELTTALHVGSGNPEGKSDAGVVRDFNGLPGLPGPGIQGLLRSACLEHPACGADAGERSAFVERVFGYTGGKGRKLADGKTDDPGRGGRVWVGWGVIHNEKNEPQADWIKEADLKKDPVLTDAARSVLRDQVKLGPRGAADNKAKFDQIVVNPGHRFSFTIKLATAPDDRKSQDSDWETLLTVLRDPALRFGGKTRRGLGKFKIITDGFEQEKKSALVNQVIERPVAPATLWMFGGGKAIDNGTKQPDSVPVSCHRIDWSGRTGVPRPVWLIPGTGIKGPLVHRTLFYANLKKGIFIDETAPDGAGEKVKTWMRQLFGSEKAPHATIGNIIIDDHFLDKNGTHAVPSAPTQMHVKINPFTGGASDSALFSDQPLQPKAATIPLRIEVRGRVDDDALACFASALEDLDQGRLALGAHSSRGYGRFKSMKPEAVELP